MKVIHRSRVGWVWLLAAAGVLAGVAACSVPLVRIEDVPLDLEVHGPQVAVVHATGVQVYTCTADAGGQLSWTLKGPDATFENVAGLKGRHYGGPTWEAQDGSKVVGRKLQEHASPTGDAVPWLLLEGVKHEGNGVLSHVSYVQRIHTAGGKAPAVENAKVGDEARVRYSADYVFYGPGASILSPD